MKILWILCGLGIAAGQFALDLWMRRMDTPGRRLGLMGGKLLLWVAFFLLMALWARQALLFGGIAALAAYSLLVILWMLRQRQKERDDE